MLEQKIFQAKSYFNYWLEAVDEHSLHSPFLFGLYRDVIKKDEYLPIFKGFENVRDSLEQSQNQIKVNDLGAGSVLGNSELRKVAQIAKYSLTPAQQSRTYYRIIEHLGCSTILELGTSLGINAMYLASVPSVTKLFTVEGCGEISAIAKGNFESYRNSKIQLVNKPIDKALDHIFNLTRSLDFVLFDANHSYEATMTYYQRCKQLANEHTVFIFDDIHWSEGMTKAWKEIQDEIEVTLTLDLYDFGIVFFKKELEKEDYILMH
ncbi:MAG: class I SAM-dependent methyltransferase [Cyclobacteriaceae bacterium]